MIVFSRLAQFLRSNKRRLVWALALLAAAVYAASHFISRRMQKMQQQLQDELIYKRQLAKRYVATQRDCYYTVLALIPVLTLPIIDAFPVEEITRALRLKRRGGAAPSEGAPLLTPDNLYRLEINEAAVDYASQSKAELWALLKQQTISRSLTLLYVIASLMLLTRIQLNVLARRANLLSAMHHAGLRFGSEQFTATDAETSQQYLSLSWWLLNRGWAVMSSSIEASVARVFGVIEPRDELTVAEFEALLLSVVEDLNTPASGMRFLGAVFPLTDEDMMETVDGVGSVGEVSATWPHLILETRKVVLGLEQPQSFYGLLQHTVASSLEVLQSEILNSLGSPEGSDVTRRHKLALFLAQLQGQNNVLTNNNYEYGGHDQRYDGVMAEMQEYIGEGGNTDEYDFAGFEECPAGNIYVNTMNDSEPIQEFSSSIYSDFD